MIYIRLGSMDDRTRITLTWHVGEPLPSFTNVVSFQADGDELDLIIEAMRGTAEQIVSEPETKTEEKQPLGSPVLSRTRLLVARDRYVTLLDKELSGGIHTIAGFTNMAHFRKQIDLIERLLAIVDEGGHE